jgi:C4-type Zn-finger protein
MNLKVKIKCPVCNKIQEAIIKDIVPYSSYIHECNNCNYIIMESEWEEIN